MTLRVGAVLRICHFNIEGISNAKSELLGSICRQKAIDVIAIQETHTVDNADLCKRGYIAGYVLIGAIHHKQYGVATYVRDNIDSVRMIISECSRNIEVLAIEICGITVINIYKPPNEEWSNPPIKLFEHPAVYVGDFNSHSQMWGYDLNDRNGDIIINWITLNIMELIYNAKEKGTFHSARWQKDYSPDLCILTRKSMTDNTTATRTVLDNFPHSQHRPVIIDYGLQIPIVRSIPKPRWNFKLAKWDKYAKDVDKSVTKEIGVRECGKIRDRNRNA